MMGHGREKLHSYSSFATFDHSKSKQPKVFKAMQHKVEGEGKFDPFSQGVADLVSVASEVGQQKSLARSRSSQFNPQASANY